MSTSTHLDSDTADYYGSDVSSVVDGRPDGFNDIAREEAYEESDTSSVTEGLTDGFNDRAVDDHIGPDPEDVMDSFADNGGVITDLTEGGSSAYDGETSESADEGSSAASEPVDGDEPADEDDEPADEDEDDEPADEPADEDEDEDDEPTLSEDSLKEDLQAAARTRGLDDSGTKKEIYARIVEHDASQA